MEEKSLIIAEKRVQCLLCDKSMEESFDGAFKSYQPYGGGEIQFLFSYGSLKFDLNMETTVYRGFICDECAEKHVHKMVKTTLGEIDENC